MSTDSPEHDPTTEPFDWEAIARYLAGESTPAEARAVRLWLDARPDRAAVVEALDRSIARLAAVDASVDVDAALARVHARMAEPSSDIAPGLKVERGNGTPRFAPRVVPAAPRAAAWRRPAAWLAAAAVVAIAAVGIARTRGQATVVAASELRTAVGRIDTLRLADGSRIVLGPDSRVAVAAGYGQRSSATDGSTWCMTHRSRSRCTPDARRSSTWERSSRCTSTRARRRRGASRCSRDRYA